MQLTSSIITEKDYRLTRQLSFVTLGGAIFYVIFDIFSEAFAYVPIYFILVAGALFALLLLRIKQLEIAKGILLLSCNIVITLFASAEVHTTGIIFYYIILSIGAFTLYGYKKIKLAIIYSALSTSLFLLTYFTDLSLIEPINLTTEYIRMSLFINFILNLAISVIIIYYLLYNNYLAETALNNQRESLIQTTNELGKSQHRFELAIQGSSAAIWDWDISKDICYTTPKLADILGRKLEKSTAPGNELLNSLIHPDDKPILQSMLDTHFNTGSPFELECRVNAVPNDVWVLVSGQAEWDNNGNPVRMVGTLVDINEKRIATEQVKEQNDKLAKANEELDRFVYSTSHDLRAPLSSLLGLINLAGNSTEKKDRDELIEMMKSQTIKLDSYIQDITDYSRNARVEVEKEEFYLEKLIQESIDNLKFMEGAENMIFSTTVDENYTLYNDKSRFKVILNNIISNAIKYKDPNKDSHLQISLDVNKDHHELIFKDNGIGINEQHITKIFDMFYRASDKSRGSGLGLYIAKETALKIDLKLKAKSVLGEGSVFTLFIPREQSILV